MVKAHKEKAEKSKKQISDSSLIMHHLLDKVPLTDRINKRRNELGKVSQAGKKTVRQGRTGKSGKPGMKKP